LASLFYDIELAADWARVLKRAGVDLDRVFEPVSGDYDRGVGYRFQQSGPLEITSSPGEPNDVAPPGQAAFGIPIEVEMLGSAHQGRLAFSVDLTTRGSKPATVRPAIGHPARLTCTPTLNFDATKLIEDRAATEITRALARTQLVTPLLDMLPKPPVFWCAWDDGMMRVAGRVLERRRGRRPFLSALPDGFPLAVRFDFEVLARKIRDVVRDQGVSLLSEPRAISDKRFRFSAGIRAHRSVKVGCSEASVDVKVSQELDARITVRNRIYVELKVEPIGDIDIDIDFNPRVPVLSDWAEGLVEDFVRDQLPAIKDFSDSYLINGAQRVDLWLQDDHVLIGLEPS